MHARLLVLTHRWPGITPLNVWDLPYDAWLIYRAGVDQYIEHEKQQQAKARSGR